LVATPVAYSLFDDLTQSRLLGKLFRKNTFEAGDTGEKASLKDSATVETVVIEKLPIVSSLRDM